MSHVSPSQASAGNRRRTMPGSVQHHPSSPSSLVRRPVTVPAEFFRAHRGQRTSEREKPRKSESRLVDLSSLEQEEWVKTSWKKGECREEIKLIAQTSGLSFDNARIVALRLYNHISWMNELQARLAKVLAVVGRERLLSLNHVRAKEALAGEALELSRDSAAGSVRGVGTGKGQGEAAGGDENSCSAAEEGIRDRKDPFKRYVRGLCVICNEGSFDQVLDVLLRTYSTSSNNYTITRNEMAVILSKHVNYEDSKDPAAEKERMYRWLKRQFIQLTTDDPSSTASASVAVTYRREVTATKATAGLPTQTAAGSRDQEGGSISWDSARELLKRAPKRLENSLAIDLACLSKDLWSSDLVDVDRTKLASSLQ